MTYATCPEAILLIGGRFFQTYVTYASWLVTGTCPSKPSSHPISCAWSLEDQALGPRVGVLGGDDDLLYLQGLYVAGRLASDRRRQSREFGAWLSKAQHQPELTYITAVGTRSSPCHSA